MNTRKLTTECTIDTNELNLIEPRESESRISAKSAIILQLSTNEIKKETQNKRRLLARI